VTTFHLSRVFLGALIALTAFSASSATMWSVTAQADQQSADVTSLIVQFESGPDGPDGLDSTSATIWLDAASVALDVSLSYERPLWDDLAVARLPQALTVAEAEALAARLSAQPGIVIAQPNYRVYPALDPNDVEYASQWHYAATTGPSYGINAPAAWDITTGSASVRVAVIDTGILPGHPDLAGRLGVGYDMISDPAIANDGGGRDADPSDPGDWVTADQCFLGSLPESSSWHGTHVAGTIGAASNNGAGVSGINWTSPILALRALGRCGGESDDIWAAMRWSIGLSVTGLPLNLTPARVINMSLGNRLPCTTLYQGVVDQVKAAGGILVVAAGNENSPASQATPGSCQNVITVASTARDGGRAVYSNFGPEIEIAAPGGDGSGGPLANGVLSTYNDGATSPANDIYDYLSGTSMATPHVAGVVSLMLSVNPDLSFEDVVRLLQQTAQPFPSSAALPCTTNTCGAGIMDAGAAVAAAQAYAPARLYLPAISRTPPAITGVLASSRASTVGLPVELLVYTPSNTSLPASLVATATVSAGGQYAFINLPALPSGRAYYTRFRNFSGNPAFLGLAYSPDVTVLSQDVPNNVGVLDVTGVDLIAPSPDAAVTMPADFSWAVRAATTDRYYIGVYDPAGVAGEVTTTSIGYRGSLRVGPVPASAGFQPGIRYAWYVGIEMPNGMLGFSLPRGITFNNVGLAALDSSRERMDWLLVIGPGSRR
jgi:serine protease